MKKIILGMLIATCASPSFASANLTSGVVEYINATHATAQQKVKAEYLVNSVSRIYTEKWEYDEQVFNSISQDISISLSCYMYELGGHNAPEGEELLDEIQTLMTDTERKRSTYLRFMRKDMKTTHEKKDRSICAALV